MTAPFRTTRRVEFCDTDMAGIVHFGNFFRYMESAEVEFLRSRGLSVRMDWNGDKIGFPRVSANCDYNRPARFEDLIEIAVTIRSIGRKSGTYGFEFTREGGAIANGQISSVCCRIAPGQSLQSIEIPPEIRARLEDLAGDGGVASPAAPSAQQ